MEVHRWSCTEENILTKIKILNPAPFLPCFLWVWFSSYPHWVCRICWISPPSPLNGTRQTYQIAHSLASLMSSVIFFYSIEYILVVSHSFSSFASFILTFIFVAVMQIMALRDNIHNSCDIFIHSHQNFCHQFVSLSTSVGSMLSICLSYPSVITTLLEIVMISHSQCKQSRSNFPKIST